MQITIEGRPVTVDDSFRSLPAEQQDATVDEIADALALESAPGSAFTEAMSNASAASQRLSGGSTMPAALRAELEGIYGLDQPKAPPVDVSNNPQASKLPGVLGDIANTWNAANEGVRQGTTLNLGDELFAGAETLVQGATGNGWDYGKNLAAHEGRSADVAALNPDAYGFGQTAGAVGLMGKPGAAPAGFVPKPLPKFLPARAAAAGGAYSSAAAFGEPGSAQDRAFRAATAFMPGALIGGTIGTAANLVGRPALPKTKTPTVADTLAASRAGFKVVENSGAVIPAGNVASYAADVRAYLAQKGLVTPSGKVVPYADVSHALNLIDDFAKGDMSVAQAMTLRETLGRAAGSSNGKERVYGRAMLEQFDRFMEQVLPANLAAEWSAARAGWHVGKKGETVEKLISTAERKSRKSRAVGIDASLRNRFDTFVDKERNLRGFTPAEQEQLKRVANGTKLGNVGKTVGGLAPSSLSGLTFKAGAPFVVGNAIGGPVVGGALAGGSVGLGWVGRLVSNLSSKHQAQLARLIVLNGGKLPTQIGRTLPAPIRAALGNLVMSAGSQSGEIGKAVLQALSIPSNAISVQP